MPVEPLVTIREHNNSIVYMINFSYWRIKECVVRAGICKCASGVPFTVICR